MLKLANHHPFQNGLNDFIGWIRQKLSKHKSYHKMKRAKRSVNLNAEEMYNQFPKVKSGCKTGRIAAHENLDVINMTIPF